MCVYERESEREMRDETERERESKQVICACTCRDTWVMELRGEPMGIDALPPPCGLQGPNLGHEAQQQEP